MLVHRGTTRHDQWCSTNQPFESTTHSRESNHKPYVYIYIYKCNNLCLNADLNVHLEGHLQKQKKLAKPTECDHQPRTNSEAATKQNRHISCLFAAMKLHYHYDMRNI